MTDYPESAEAAQASPTALAPNTRDPWDGSPIDRPTLYVSEDMPPLVADDADALLAALDRARTALSEEFPHLATPSPLDAARSLYGTAHGAVPFESVPAGPFLLDEGKPVDGQVWSHPGDVKCAQCGGICTADREDEPVPAAAPATQPDAVADEQDGDLLDDVRPNAREVALAMVALYKGRPIRDVKDLDPSDLQDLLTDLIHLARATQSLPDQEHLDILRSAEFIADDEDNDTHGVRHVLPAATLAAVPA